MEKRLFNIYNSEKDLNHYLKLADSEVDFLYWLNEIGYLDDDTNFYEVSKLPTPIEF